MSAPHLGEQGGEDVQAYGHPSDEPHGAVEGLLSLADTRDGILQVPEDAVAELQKRLTSGSDAYSTADAVKNRFSQFLLEEQNLPADGRLGHVKLLARRGEGTRVGDGPDDLELSEVHWRSIHARCACILRDRCA